MLKPIRIPCLAGRSASRDVLLGFASARLLRSISFVDVLDEERGVGYQRRFNSSHSLDFRRYIQGTDSATIPLTFNLRPVADDAWSVVTTDAGCMLTLDQSKGPLLSQVDCQHRLGHLSDLDVELPFMCFQGLTVTEEMAVFNVINGKAKGLSRSLLDYHDARLCDDLGTERPELFIALCLTNDVASPWHGQLDIGGNSTSGMRRRASLRTMQKAVRKFLNRSHILETRTTEEAAKYVLDFWFAVSVVLADAWHRPRTHLLTKGVGVYALMELAADLWADLEGAADRPRIMAALSDFAVDFDWSTGGPLQGLGGEGGVASATAMIRELKRSKTMRVAA